MYNNFYRMTLCRRICYYAYYPIAEASQPTDEFLMFSLVNNLCPYSHVQAFYKLHILSLHSPDGANATSSGCSISSTNNLVYTNVSIRGVIYLYLTSRVVKITVVLMATTLVVRLNYFVLRIDQHHIKVSNFK